MGHPAELRCLVDCQPRGLSAIQTSWNTACGLSGRLRATANRAKLWPLFWPLMNYKGMAVEDTTRLEGPHGDKGT